jgi:hypothetical protein
VREPAGYRLDDVVYVEAGLRKQLLRVRSHNAQPANDRIYMPKISPNWRWQAQSRSTKPMLKRRNAKRHLSLINPRLLECGIFSVKEEIAKHHGERKRVSRPRARVHFIRRRFTTVTQFYTNVINRFVYRRVCSSAGLFHIARTSNAPGSATADLYRDIYGSYNSNHRSFQFVTVTGLLTTGN